MKHEIKLEIKKRGKYKQEKKGKYENRKGSMLTIEKKIK